MVGLLFFHQIQSALNHIWGKGRRLEIHVNHLSHSMLVRIPNDYIREKVLEKCIWYIGDSMFHTAPWASHYNSESHALDSIPIWIHMLDIPLNLRTKEGISLVSGLVGEPKETNDFTLNLVSLKVSHAKVLVDLTKTLPSVVEFTRDNGQVVEVEIVYPWLPPTCSHCKELGHIVRNCLKLPPEQAPPPKVAGPKSKERKASGAPSRKGKEKVDAPHFTKVSRTVDLEAQPSIAKPTTKLPETPLQGLKTFVSPNQFSSLSSTVSPITTQTPTLLNTTSLPVSTTLVPKKIPLKIPTSKNSKPKKIPDLPMIIGLPASITPEGLPYPYSPTVSLKRSRSHPSLLTPFSSPNQIVALPFLSPDPHRLIPSNPVLSSNVTDHELVLDVPLPAIGEASAHHQ